MHFPEIRTALLAAVLPAFAVTVTPLSADAPLERFTANITRAQVADLQNGANGLPGTADDIRVLGYISFGEDNHVSIYERDVNGDFVYVDGFLHQIRSP
ncbi:hypothetical protein OpiT1DRAFT_05186 [Opitutaceae bacterium TAV1]|nr:hypothetical protein OpiT1DRAFT_05186 [Opitutaceae bacterium TAV1]